MVRTKDVKVRLKDRNNLLEIIKNSELDIQQFSLSEGNLGNEAYVDINLDNSPLYFRIYTDPDSFGKFQAEKIPFSPSYNIVELSVDSDGTLFNISTLNRFFTNWLNRDVKAYIEEQVTEDLWQQNAIEELLDIENIQFDIDKVFEDNEKVLVKFYLEDLKATILQQHQLTADKIEKINQRFDELEKSSHKLTKKDWKVFALSIFASIVITVGVPRIEDLIQPFAEQVQAIKTIKQPKLEKTPENFI